MEFEGRERACVPFSCDSDSDDDDDDGGNPTFLFPSTSFSSFLSLSPPLSPPPPPQVRTLAVDPSGRTLLSVDRSGRGILLLLRRGGGGSTGGPGRGQLRGKSFSRRPPASTVVLGRITFKAPVTAAVFSPCGRYLAVAVGRLVQVWTTPLSSPSSPSSADSSSTLPTQAPKVPSPLALHRTYGHCSGEVTCLCWSPCGCWLAGGSRDLTVRVWSLDPIRFPENASANSKKKWRTARFVPPTLAAHKEPPVAVCFAEGASAQAPLSVSEDAPSHPPPALYSLSRDGTLCVWCFDKEEETGGDGADPVAAAAAAAWGDDDEDDEDEEEEEDGDQEEEEEEEEEGDKEEQGEEEEEE